MNSLFNKRCIDLKPYVVSSRNINDNNDWIILDWNESSFKLDEILKKKLIDEIQNGTLNLYSDIESSDLILALAEFNKVGKQNLLVFNGSDSALNTSFECIIENSDNVLLIDPDYSQVHTFIHMKSGKINFFKLDQIEKPSTEKLSAAIKGNKVFYFSNPNNPIGFNFSKEDVEYLVKDNPQTMFFIDEAYSDFSKTSVISLIENYSNIIIFKTFSKAFGVAGLRLGYAISQSENINLLSKVRNGKEINTLAQVSGTFLINNYEMIQKRVDEIINVRDFFYNEVNNLNLFKVFPSEANYLLIKHPEHLEIIKDLKNNKILVRDRSSMHLLSNCFRVTIGQIDEMKKILEILKKYQ